MTLTEIFICAVSAGCLILGFIAGFYAGRQRGYFMGYTDAWKKSTDKESEIKKIVDKFEKEKHKITPIQVIRVCDFFNWYNNRLINDPIKWAHGASGTGNIQQTIVDEYFDDLFKNRKKDADTLN